MKNEMKNSVKMAEMDIQNLKAEENKGKKRGNKPKKVFQEAKPEVSSEPIREKMNFNDAVGHYNRGFEEGKKAGYEDGWKNAHRQGYEEGYEAGRKEAYRTACEEGEYGEEEYGDSLYSTEEHERKSYYTNDDYEEDEYEEEDDDYEEEDADYEEDEEDEEEVMAEQNMNSEVRKRFMAFNSAGNKAMENCCCILNAIYTGIAAVNILTGIDLFSIACVHHEQDAKKEGKDMIELGMEMIERNSEG